MGKVISAVNTGQRKNFHEIISGTSRRLVAMSVGKIILSNYNTAENEKSWISGYKILIINTPGSIKNA